MKKNHPLRYRTRAAALLRRLAEYFGVRGVRAYLVGGYVRDFLLGRATADIDIAVQGDAREIARDLAEALSGTFVLLDDENRIGRVVVSGQYAPSGGSWNVDLSSLRGDIENDLRQRDFTVNAMAIELKKPQDTGFDLIDPLGGQRDLKAKLIKAVCRTVFEDDPARLLRAVRLAAELGMTIDEGTEMLIHGHARLASDVAGERAREEFVRLLSLPGAARQLSYLDRLALLTVIVPELADTKGVEQPKEHHWDVFEHSIQTVAAVEAILKEGPWDFAGEEILDAVPSFPDFDGYFRQEVAHGSDRRFMLKLAALLHDNAKPQTKTLDEKKNRTRFLGHPEIGAEIAGAILERLRFSNIEIKLLKTMVKYHLRPGQMSQEGMPTKRAIYRYFRDTEGVGIDTLYLSLADFMASRGPDIDLTAWCEQTAMIGCVLSRHLEVEQAQPVKLVSGHDLMKLGIEQGPELGRLLERVREAQGAGEITTREEALAMVSKLSGKRRPINAA